MRPLPVIAYFADDAVSGRYFHERATVPAVSI